MEASVFDDIFFPHTTEKYRAAPLVEQRERYLVHLKATGATRSTLRKCANDQLSLVRLLDLKDGDRVSRSQIEVAAALWSQPRGRRCDRAASRKTRDRFVSHGVRSLGFLGWLDDGRGGRHPHEAEVQAFARWLREERGLSDATVQSYRAAADHFFGHLAAKGVRLSAVGMTDRRYRSGGARARRLGPPDETRLCAASEGVLLVRRDAGLVPSGPRRRHR